MLGVGRVENGAMAMAKTDDKILVLAVAVVASSLLTKDSNAVLGEDDAIC